MARVRRSQRANLPVPPETRESTGRRTANQQLRVHCAMCGMMANMERIEETQAYAVDTFVQYWGGRKNIHYEPAPEYAADAMRLQLARIGAIRDYLTSELSGEIGIEEEPEEEEIDDEADDDFDDEEEDETEPVFPDDQIDFDDLG